MAPTNWPTTREMLKREIAKMIRNPRAASELITPSPTPYPRLANVQIAFPGFLKWLRDFAASRIPVLERDVRTLRQEIARYESRKRAYDNWVLRNLKSIHDSHVGRSVLAEIAARPALTVTIEPYLRDRRCDYNATVAYDDDEAATARGMPIRDAEGRATGGSGTGTGSDATVGFTPGIWNGPFEQDVGVTPQRFTTCAPQSGPGSRPDEVLLHELVHAARSLRGVSYLLAVSAGYHNEEEFVAVLVANVYLSEKGRELLRANHSGFKVLQSPDKFLDDVSIRPDPRTLVQRLRNSQPGMYAALVRAPAAFNPVRQYDQEDRAIRQHFARLAGVRL